MPREYWNPERETMGMDELRELQNEKVRDVVARAYNNAPIVRGLWDEAGVTPDDVDTVEDLAAAPVFRKDDSRDRMIETGEPYGGRLCIPSSELDEEGAMIGTSSGTTGTPTNIVLSQHDLSVAAECLARSFWEMGLRPGDVLLSPVVPTHLASAAFRDGAGRIGAYTTEVYHDPRQSARIVHVLEYLRPTVVKILSGPLLRGVEEHIEAEGLDPREVWEPVESVGLAGEPVIPSERERIEDLFGVEVFENFGSMEPNWYPTECREHGRWCHVQDDHFYVEVRDPETGERVDEGERGLLVVTALSGKAMAHVCWDHDDIVEMERGTCACGRTGTRIRVLGRVGDLVEVDGRSLLPWDVMLAVDSIEEMPGNLFQFYPDPDEALRLRIGYAADRVDDVDAFRAAVRADVEEAVRVPVEVIDLVTEAEMRDLGPEHKIPRMVSE